jgi:glycosyltransferase involved in cell wall biosynthesis
MPALSAVVVAFNGRTHLERCLRALQAQSRGGSFEIVVVAKAERLREASPLRDALPSVRWIEAAPAQTIPQMRSLGIRHARGSIVALLEDDCVPSPVWADAVLRAHTGPDVAVGGAVEPGAYRRALDWAVYFCEYARFMLPLPERTTWVLPGNNVSYKREAVAALNDTDGLEEAFVHRSWHEQGRPMKADPDIVVSNENSWTLAHVSSVPFHHARAFAGKRLAGARRPRRLIYAACAGALPVVHTGRIIARVARRPRRLLDLARAFAWVALFGLSWSAGECVGYACGPGLSRQRWS